MSITRNIRQLLSACSIHMHEKRRRAVADAVVGLLECGRIVAASVGRAMAQRTSDKHGIRRIDRLLGNSKLHGEVLKIGGVRDRDGARSGRSLRDPQIS